MALTKKSEKSSNRNTCEYVHFGMYHLRDRPYTNTLQILFSKSGIYVKEQIRGEGGRRESEGEGRKIIQCIKNMKKRPIRKSKKVVKELVKVCEAVRMPCSSLAQDTFKWSLVM
jgi:hypothetical protein